LHVARGYKHLLGCYPKLIGFFAERYLVVTE
jgi:hypothetical protein